ncbi:MAG: hypothetical protein FD187_790 [bacterium]|nr:MAG: hypothetical protein FD142_633 [bacterium]KAF0149833.1 MAG: hypothetical protein FD187_790 [bacterium]KAF0168534.1 MAG: hypothetical protein FD158_1254 [bacterium]TXT19533.1 MAG: hypothetical protein FD132_1667 [bacterium]
MNPIESLRSYFVWSRPIRDVYGPLKGLRIAWQLRRAMWAAPAG